MRVWLGFATLSTLGDGCLYFAIGWAATGIGGGTAGLMLTLITLPRLLLSLPGGSLADRHGLRQVMISTDAAMSLGLAGYLVLRWGREPGVGDLAALAIAVGVVSAIYFPAVNAFPRAFVDEAGLAKAMATKSVVFQLARLAGPPLGALLVLRWSLDGVVLADLATFVAVFVALLCVRPPREQTLARADRADGRTLTLAWRTRGMPGMLGAVGLLAAAVMPVLSIVVPLAARSRGWGPAGAGVVESAWVVGTLSVTLVVARRGAAANPVRVAVGGAALTAISLGVLAVARPVTVAVIAGVALGVGTAAFTTQVMPLFVTATPAGYLARFQALLGIVQAGALVVANNALGWLAQLSGERVTLAVCALCALAAGAVLAGQSRISRSPASNRSTSSSLV